MQVNNKPVKTITNIHSLINGIVCALVGVAAAAAGVFFIVKPFKDEDGNKSMVFPIIAFILAVLFIALGINFIFKSIKRLKTLNV